MASKRSADRFLAPLAKVARAGLIPALVAAALLVSGCGGGDDSSAAGEASSTSASAAVQEGAGATEGTGAGRGAAGGEGAGEGPSAGGSNSGSGAAGGSNDSQATKNGSRVSIPEGEPEPAPTPKQRAEATVADLTLYSPDFPASDGTPAIPTVYTCEGKDSWPRFSWGAIPQGTKELALLAMNSQPVKDELFFDWAVAGIDPSFSGIEAGKLPKGAVMGKNSFGQTGYSICPPPQSKETYVFLLYALPEALDPEKGFAPLPFREAALDVSHKAGLMAATYTRG